jgi:hypothetical protein
MPNNSEIDKTEDEVSIPPPSAKKTDSKSKHKKAKKRRVSIMQDDIASVISKKNHTKGFKKVSGDKEDLEVQRKLTEVYSDGDGAIPDLTRLEIIQRPLWKTILYVLIAVFSVLFFMSLLGFWLFGGFGVDNFTNEQISLKIETPITLVSGQESVYTVVITNRENIDLFNLELELFYPDNFEYINASPQASGDKNNKWDFSVLKVGETKRIELKGKVLSALKSTETFRGTLNFKPANLNATFKQEAIIELLVASSVLSMDIEGPDKTLSNQDVEYTIKYQNLGEDDFESLQVVATYADGFVFDSSEPETTDDKNSTWDIGELKAGDSGEIVVSGNYSATQDSGNRDFVARIQLEQDGDYYPQSEVVHVTDVIKDQLSMQLIVNGSGEDQPISFGSLLVYSLSYKNTGEDDLEDIQITANLDSQIIDWSSLKDENNGVRSNNTITWTGRHIPNMLKLGPGEEGQITWQVRVNDASVVLDDSIGKFSVESYVEAKAQQTGEVSGESLVTSKTIVNSVNSDLDMTVVARYYSEDDIALGLGPIEPEVGEISTLNIKIDLSNNLNDVENVNFRAKLPNNVRWSGRENHAVGDLFYNAAASEVVWNISRINKSPNNTVASFNVDIEPTDGDRGRILILLSDINIVAKDADTGADINKTAKAITTSFDDPILGRINGIVK